MSLENLNNWFSRLSRKDKLAKTLKDNDILTLGRLDNRSFNNFNPIGIRYADFLRLVKNGGSASSNGNTWDLPNTAFVDPSYSAGGVLGDGNQPFQTVAQANISGASNIYLKPGNHVLNVVSNKTYYAAPGATASTVDDGGITATNVSILGDLHVTAFLGINVTGVATDLYAEVLKITGPSSVRASNGAKVFAKVKEGVNSSGINGAGFSAYVVNGSSVIIETPYHYTTHFAASNSGNDNYFELRCPDVKIFTGGYGNLAKALFNCQGGTGNTYILNLMGGNYENQNVGQSVSFGVQDTALLLNVNSTANNGNSFLFKNGTVDAGDLYGIGAYFSVTGGIIELENIELKSNTIAIRTFSNNLNAGYLTINAKDCAFESGESNILGNNRIGDFLRCTFKVNGIAVAIFTFDPLNPADLPTYTFKDCYAVLDSGVGEMLTGFATATLGLLNTYSSEVLGVGAVDTWGGFTNVPTLTVPNIEL